MTAAISAALVVWSACGTEQTAFDPAALSESADEVITAMQGSPALQSMGTFGDQMNPGAPAMGPALAALALPPVPLDHGGFVAWGERHRDAMQATLPALAAAAPEDIIPPAALGKTFEYNGDAYVLSDRTGAPANGVRFILYAVTPITHEIVTPLNEVGYVDLIEKSSTSIQAIAVIDGETLVDYTASASVQKSGQTVTGATVNASGFVSDGTTQVDYDLTQTFSSTAGISVDYDVSIAERDIEARFEASIGFLGTATATLTLKNGGNTTIVSASGTTAAITGTIKHNGTVVINISGTADNPVFTNASGEALTDAQVTALKKIFKFTDALLSAVDLMLAPAHHLLTPGVAF